MSDTVSIKSMLLPHVSVKTNLREPDSPLDQLAWAHITVMCVINATSSLSAPDGRYEPIGTMLQRADGETGHAFRLRVTQTLDVMAAMFVRGRHEQQRAIQSALGIGGSRKGAYLKGQMP